MKTILIIKTGAAGDIVRTTVLLNALQGEITWIADKKYHAILPAHHPHLKNIIAPADAVELLKEKKFDLTISLEENIECANLAITIPTNKIIGIYALQNEIKYTADSSGWFDMSLLSAKGSEYANRIKLENKLSFQYWLFNMLGLSFNKEEYCIYKNEIIRTNKKLVGIEKRAGDRWPNKLWGGYDSLIDKISNRGFEIKILSQRDSVKEYLDDIAECSYIISGDTLAMHAAIAYKKPCLAIFNCTSPSEIYDYGILKKIINPLLSQAFYKTEFNEQIINALGVNEVENVFNSLLD